MTSSKGFRTVGFFDKGYAKDEVDDFLHRAKEAYNGPLTPNFDENTIRNAAFHRQRRGYLPADVDEALDRLEAAFIQKRRSLVVADRGENAWLNTTAQEVRNRLQAQAASLQRYTQEFLSTRAVIRVSLLALVILLF